MSFYKKVLVSTFRKISPYVQVTVTHLPTGKKVTGDTYGGGTERMLKHKLLRRLAWEVGEKVEES